MQELLDRELPPGGELRWHAGRRIALYRHCPEGSQARSREYPELPGADAGGQRPLRSGNRLYPL